MHDWNDGVDGSAPHYYCTCSWRYCYWAILYNGLEIWPTLTASSGCIMTMRDAGKCSRYNLVSLLGFNIIFQMLQCDYSHILLSTAENLCKCILKTQDLNYVTHHQCNHLDRRLKFFLTRYLLPFYTGNLELYLLKLCFKLRSSTSVFFSTGHFWNNLYAVDLKDAISKNLPPLNCIQIGGSISPEWLQMAGAVSWLAQSDVQLAFGLRVVLWKVGLLAC